MHKSNGVFLVFAQKCYFFLIQSDNGMLRGDIKYNEVAASGGKVDDIDDTFLFFLSSNC